MKQRAERKVKIKIAKYKQTQWNERRRVKKKSSGLDVRPSFPVERTEGWGLRRLDNGGHGDKGSECVCVCVCGEEGGESLMNEPTGSSHSFIRYILITRSALARIKPGPGVPSGGQILRQCATSQNDIFETFPTDRCFAFNRQRLDAAVSDPFYPWQTVACSTWR